jgi:hypothetical protein
MAVTETTTNLKAARSAVYDMEEGVRALGEYAKVLLFLGAGCKAHGDPGEAIERVAMDMADRADL